MVDRKTILTLSAALAAWVALTFFWALMADLAEPGPIEFASAIFAGVSFLAGAVGITFYVFSLLDR